MCGEADRISTASGADPYCHLGMPHIDLQSALGKTRAVGKGAAPIHQTALKWSRGWYFGQRSRRLAFVRVDGAKLLKKRLKL
jgi:hypothetical protein